MYRLFIKMNPLAKDGKCLTTKKADLHFWLPLFTVMQNIRNTFGLICPFTKEHKIWHGVCQIKSTADSYRYSVHSLHLFSKNADLFIMFIRHRVPDWYAVLFMGLAWCDKLSLPKWNFGKLLTKTFRRCWDAWTLPTNFWESFDQFCLWKTEYLPSSDKKRRTTKTTSS